MTGHSVQMRVFVGMLAATVSVGCSDEARVDASSRFTTAPSLSQKIPPVSRKAPGTVEDLRVQRSFKPRTTKLLESGRKDWEGTLATTLEKRPRAEDVLRLSPSASARISPEQKDLLRASVGLPSDVAFGRPRYVPTRTIHVINENGQLYRVAEYSYKGELLARVHLGLSHTSSSVSRAEPQPLTGFVKSVTPRPVSFAAQGELPEFETYAEGDSMTIDEVADYIALTYAVESEVDNSIVIAEQYLDELPGGEIVSNPTPEQRAMVAARCSAADSPANSEPTLLQVKQSKAARCLGRISTDIVSAAGVKGVITWARTRATGMLAQYVVSTGVRYAIMAGMVTGGSMVIVAASTIYMVSEGIDYCNSLPAAYIPLQEQRQGYQQAVSRTRPRLPYS